MCWFVLLYELTHYYYVFVVVVFTVFTFTIVTFNVLLVDAFLAKSSAEVQAGIDIHTCDSRNCTDRL